MKISESYIRALKSVGNLEAVSEILDNLKILPDDTATKILVNAAYVIINQATISAETYAAKYMIEDSE